MYTYIYIYTYCRIKSAFSLHGQVPGIHNLYHSSKMTFPDTASVEYRHSRWKGDWGSPSRYLYIYI